jgi:hypothetical protein
LEGKQVSSQNAVMSRVRAALHLVRKVGVIDRRMWRARSALLVFGPAVIDSDFNVDFPAAPAEVRGEYQKLSSERDVLIGRCFDLLASEEEMLEAEIRSAVSVAYDVLGEVSLDEETSSGRP